MEVRGADGRVWEVRRQIRWPRRRRFAGPTDPGDWLPWTADVPTDVGGIVGALVVGVVVTAVVAVLIVVFLPLVVFVFEALAVVAAAVALGRPWLVVASTDGPPAEEKRWLVRGIFASRRAVSEVANELRRGVPAEPQGFEPGSP